MKQQLQQIVQDMTEVVGLATTIEIIRRWGGRDWYVPKTVEPQDPLALTLGLEPARKFVAVFGGDRLTLPAERNVLMRLRDQAIVDRLKAGESREKIGLDFGICRQRVTQIERKSYQH